MCVCVCLCGGGATVPHTSFTVPRSCWRGVSPVDPKRWGRHALVVWGLRAGALPLIELVWAQNSSSAQWERSGRMGVTRGAHITPCQLRAAGAPGLPFLARQTPFPPSIQNHAPEASPSGSQLTVCLPVPHSTPQQPLALLSHIVALQPTPACRLRGIAEAPNCLHDSSSTCPTTCCRPHPSCTAAQYPTCKLVEIQSSQ